MCADKLQVFRLKFSFHGRTLTLLIPAAFFGALDPDTQTSQIAVVSATREDFLKISRALSIFLLVMYILLPPSLRCHSKELWDRYICSRFYLHDPPGSREDLHEREDAPESFKAVVQEMEREDPDVNPWVCIILLAVTVVFIGFTTEFVSLRYFLPLVLLASRTTQLVQSVRPLEHRFKIKEEYVPAFFFFLFLIIKKP